MQAYAVIWSTGSCDDHGNAHSFCGTHGVFKSETSAQKALEACKDELLADINNDLDPDGDMPECVEEANIQVHGSVEYGYFKIDYTIGTEPVEAYIRIQYTFVQD